VWRFIRFGFQDRNVGGNRDLLGSQITLAPAQRDVPSLSRHWSVHGKQAPRNLGGRRVGDGGTLRCMGNRVGDVFVCLEGGYFLSRDKIVIGIRGDHEAGEACHNGGCQNVARLSPTCHLDFEYSPRLGCRLACILRRNALLVLSPDRIGD
jgi:hypothetical protein